MDSYSIDKRKQVVPSKEQLDQINKQIERENYLNRIKATREQEKTKALHKVTKFQDNQLKKEQEDQRNEYISRIEQKKQELEELEERKLYVENNLKNKAFQDAEQARLKRLEEEEKKKLEKQEMSKKAHLRGSSALRTVKTAANISQYENAKIKNRIQEVRNIEANKAHQNAENQREFKKSTLQKNSSRSKLNTSKINSIDFTQTNFNCVILDENNQEKNLLSAYELAEKHQQEKMEKQREKELKQKLNDAEKLQKKINKQHPQSQFELYDYSEQFNRVEKQDKIKKTEETSSHVLNELQRDPRFKEVKQNNEKMNNIRKEQDRHQGDFDNHDQQIGHANNASELQAKNHINQNTSDDRQINQINHTISDPDWARNRNNSHANSYERSQIANSYERNPYQMGSNERSDGNDITQVNNQQLQYQKNKQSINNNLNMNLSKDLSTIEGSMIDNNFNPSVQINNHFIQQPMPSKPTSKSYIDDYFQHDTTDYNMIRNGLSEIANNNEWTSPNANVTANQYNRDVYNKDHSGEQKVNVQTNSLNPNFNQNQNQRDNFAPSSRQATSRISADMSPHTALYQNQYNEASGKNPINELDVQEEDQSKSKAKPQMTSKDILQSSLQPDQQFGNHSVADTTQSTKYVKVHDKPDSQRNNGNANVNKNKQQPISPTHNIYSYQPNVSRQEDNSQQDQSQNKQDRSMTQQDQSMTQNSTSQYDYQNQNNQIETSHANNNYIKTYQNNQKQPSLTQNYMPAQPVSDSLQPDLTPHANNYEQDETPSSSRRFVEQKGVSDYNQFKKENQTQIDNLKAQDVITFNSVKRGNANNKSDSAKKTEYQSLYSQLENDEGSNSMGNDREMDKVVNMNKYNNINQNRYIQSDSRSQDTDYLINQMKVQYGQNPIQIQSTHRSTDRNHQDNDYINLNNYTNQNDNQNNNLSNNQAEYNKDSKQDMQDNMQNNQSNNQQIDNTIKMIPKKSPSRLKNNENFNYDIAKNNGSSPFRDSIDHYDQNDNQYLIEIPVDNNENKHKPNSLQDAFLNKKNVNHNHNIHLTPKQNLFKQNSHKSNKTLNSNTDNESKWNKTESTEEQNENKPKMTQGKAGKTKEELFQIRKQMMKPKTQPRKLEVVEEFLNTSKSRTNPELMNRLATGNKANVDLNESRSRSKTMQHQLPEQKVKRDEKKKQQDLIQRQKKMQEQSQSLRLKY